MLRLAAKLLPVLVVFLSLAFAGCAGAGGAGSVTSTGPPPAAVPTVSSSTGSVTGVVLDDEARPVVGADVAVTSVGPAATQSDLTGRFTINDLAPGDHNVVAQKLGFESAGKRVTVVAGETIELNFNLKSIAIDSEPRSVFTTYDGYVDGDVYTAAAGLYYPRTFNVNLTQGASEVVTSMDWDPSAPLFARYFRVSLTYDGDRNATSGRPALTVKLSELEVTKAKDKAVVSYGVNFACGLDPLCFVNNPDALVPQIAYQQRVHFYNTVFYNSVAAEGYTGLPP